MDPQMSGTGRWNTGWFPSFLPWASGMEDWKETGWRSGCGIRIRALYPCIQGLSAPHLCRRRGGKHRGQCEAELFLASVQ